MWSMSRGASPADATPAERPKAAKRTRAKNPQPWPRAYVYRRVIQAKLYIDEHYAEPIDVACISAEAEASKFHFIRIFKQVTGSTPHRYLADVRIAQAKARLAAGAQVTEVCFAVGFASLGSFSATFKRIVGASPSAYRAQQRRREVAIQEQPLAFVPECFARMRGWMQPADPSA
jgi:AraC-like DNA-binding protein